MPACCTPCYRAYPKTCPCWPSPSSPARQKPCSALSTSSPPRSACCKAQATPVIWRRLLDAWQSFAKAPQWRAARWATGIAIVAQLIGLNAWAFKENRSIAERQQQAKQVLQTTFPHVPVIVDAPVQMQRELDVLRSNSGALSAADLETLLAASATISSMPNAKSLEYQDKQLRITGLDLNPEALSDAQQSLEASGYQLQREGADLILSAKTHP